MLGYGPIERFLADPTVTEVMVNGGNPIYVERGGRLYRTDARFASEARLRLVIDTIVSAIGRRIDESSPMVDARLADGSRVNAIIPPLAIDGPALTIRKFAKHRLTVDDLISFGTLDARGRRVPRRRASRGRLNILISGGTGTGKTTLLNVLSSLIADDERIVTIEDAAELQLDQDHLIRLESRPANIEGRGEVAIRDLVRNALRMRPDRIIVGEVRGAEALDMLQAMNTGHDGSLSTVHANSPRDALVPARDDGAHGGHGPAAAGDPRPDRLGARPDRAHQPAARRLPPGHPDLRDRRERGRRRQHVRPLRLRLLGRASTHDGRHLGTLMPTGLRPTFAERLRDLGIELPARLLGIDAPVLQRPGVRR